MTANGDSVRLAQAGADYAAALAALRQPAWPADQGPADPYGRSLALVDGDLQFGRSPDGRLGLSLVSGPPELAQGLQILIGTPQGSDIFNLLFGFELQKVLMQPKGVPEMRQLIRMSVVKALAQEPRVRQIRAVAFADEPEYRRIHPELTAEQQAVLARAQRLSRRWRMGLLLDTRLGDQVTAEVEGVGP